MKPIDIVDVKAAVRDGQLYVGVSGEGDIYLCDSKNGESVCIAEKMPFLRALRDEVYADAVAHGLWEDADIKESLMGLTDVWTDLRLFCAVRVSEETDELIQAGKDEEHFIEELADVIIMSLSVAGHLGIDIDKAVKRKMTINKTRPWKHKEG